MDNSKTYREKLMPKLRKQDDYQLQKLVEDLLKYTAGLEQNKNIKPPAGGYSLSVRPKGEEVLKDFEKDLNRTLSAKGAPAAEVEADVTELLNYARSLI